MKYIKISSILFLMFFGSCCNQYSKKTSEPGGANEMQPANLPKENNDNKLSPGTAKVASTVLVLPDSSNNIKIKVKSVLGYGMATRAIAPNTEMDVIIHENQINLLKGINVGDNLNLIISQEQPMGSKSPGWIVVDIIN